MPCAVAVTRGPLFHILGAVEVWDVIVAPPPSLARFAKPIEWTDALGDALGTFGNTTYTEHSRGVAEGLAGSCSSASRATRVCTQVDQRRSVTTPVSGY